MSTTSSSPLLRLPGELRNEIYTYVLGGHIFGYPFRQRKFKPRTPVNEHIISLLLVCRQTYHEARDFLFKHNTFIIHSSETRSSRRISPPIYRPPMYSPPNYSFHSLGKEQKALIRTVRLNIASFDLWRLSRWSVVGGEFMAVEESEVEKLRIDKRSHLDLLEDVKGSVKKVEMAAVDYPCEGIRERYEESTQLRRAREWLEREILKRVEGVEVRFVWVTSDHQYLHH